ncbi:GNAT family N-acetyltransferase [Streptomyces sp. JW3]|uniref:GNAT family N-acetyltransferase n=1 Tax=Streptomyces sp. JW3 TaxID=3456955 RepID=UPI003FA43CA2
MTVSLRDLRLDVRSDVEEFARVRHLALPFILWTPDAVVHHLTHTHPDTRARSLVAEENGEVLGTAQLGLVHESPEPGQAYLNVYVRPDRPRRGAGGVLVRAAEEYLAAQGATRVYSWVLDAPGNRAFAERYGYRAGRSAHFLRLDLSQDSLPPLQPAAPGVELRTAADYADDPRPLFALDAETTADEPSDVDTTLADYQAWCAETWLHPMLSHDLTTVAVVDGRPVAFTAAYRDGGTRYSTAMTGTARAFRSRGLAKLVKNASLHRARAAGCTEAFTGNDTGNDAMLAVNKWFGYEVCATEVRYVRELG